MSRRLLHDRGSGTSGAAKPERFSIEYAGRDIDNSTSWPLRVRWAASDLVEVQIESCSGSSDRGESIDLEPPFVG